MQPLTEKQIKRLQGTVKRYVWVKWILIFLIFASLLSEAIQIYEAKTISRESGFTMQQVFDLVNYCHPEKTYQGSLITAAGKMITAMLYANVSFVFLVFWVFAHQQVKKNKMLLYYVEQLQSTIELPVDSGDCHAAND